MCLSYCGCHGNNYCTINKLNTARRDDEIQAKLKAFKEAARCSNLGPTTLPSVCFYTILNTKNRSMNKCCKPDPFPWDIGLLQALPWKGYVW